MVALFPTLSGQSLEITRSPLWSGGVSVQTAVSGKETTIAYWANPRWRWEIKFDFLRRGMRYGINRTELAELMSFFNSRRSLFEAFLYNERDDNSVLGQGLGAVNGPTLQLLRTMGTFTEPILAPLTLTNVRADNILINPLFYTFSLYGTASPGVLTWDPPNKPNDGHIITADITYAWPVRFEDTQLDFERFMDQLYSNKSVKMISKK